MSDSAPGKPPFRKRRLWVILTALALVVLSIVLLLPVAVQTGLRNWLLDNGGEQVQVTDVDLNLFTGVLWLKGVRIDTAGGNALNVERAGLDLAWLPLLQRRITIQALTLDGVHLDIARDEEGRLRVGGIEIPAGQDSAATAEQTRREQAPAWTFGIDTLSVSDSAIRYRDPKLQMETRIERLGLRHLAAWQPATAAALSLRASINDAPLTFEGRVAPFADSPWVDGRIDLQDLPLVDFQQIIGISEHQAGRLSLNTALSLSLPAANMALQLTDSTLQLDQLQWVMPQIQLQQESLRWTGDIDLKQTNGTLQVSGTGDISGQQLETTLPPQKLKFTQQALQMAIEFQLESGDTDDEMKISARLTTLQVDELHSWSDDFPLTGMSRLAIDRLNLHDPRSLRIGKVHIEQGYVAKAAGKTPPLFGTHRLDIERLSFNEGQPLNIDTIQLKQAKLYLSRAADGGGNLEALKAATGKMANANTTEATPNDKQTAQRPTTFHIGHIKVSDDSSIVFDDAAVTPKTRLHIGIDSLELDNIDNSSADQVTQLKGKGTLGRFGHYRFSGSLQPFADKLTARIIASIEGLDLPPLSPYTARDLGFRLRSGTLSSNIEVAIEKDRLNGEIKLTLQQLALIPLQQAEGAGEKQQKGGMSIATLDTSLDMLRDSNNTISLSIPLSGDINAPDFNINDAINQALMTAARNGAMTYFLYALQPYGTMLAVAKIAGEQIAKVRLDPVTFSPGASQLDDTARDYLKKVAGILSERPKVAIKVCGIAVDRDATALATAPGMSKKTAEKAPEKETVDQEALHEQLQQLAQQRAIAVREFIISQAGKAGHQLVSCLPEVESGQADAVPRVELLI